MKVNTKSCMVPTRGYGTMKYWSGTKFARDAERRRVRCKWITKFRADMEVVGAESIFGCSASDLTELVATKSKLALRSITKMVYVPHKDLVKAVQVALDNAKDEGGNSPSMEALIDAVEALLALVENDAK